MPARLILAALGFFAIASVVGAVLAVFGPASAFRLLGLVALGFGLAGLAVQVYALHEFAPGDYTALRERIAGLARRAVRLPEPLASAS